jgi:lysophospholipase
MSKEKNYLTNNKPPVGRLLLKVLLFVIIAFCLHAFIYNLVNSYDGSSAKLKVLETSDTTNAFYIPQRNYEMAMNRDVIPYVDSLQKTGTFTNAGHLIAYNTYLIDTPKANIVISHGFTERKEKYKEVIYYFLKMHYQVFILDHYSHGTSGRSTNDSSKVDVDDYQVLVEDLNKFITGPVKEHSKGVKNILFCHSMGGGIGARTVEEYPDIVDGIILNAPMMKINSPSAPPEFMSDPIAKMMVVLGYGKNYALGHRAYNANTDRIYKPSNPATFCTIKGEYWHNYIRSSTKYPSHGASWNTASTFFDLTHDVVKKKNVEKIHIPILLFQAERDGNVAPEGQYTFANNAGNIEFFLVKGAGHEIYIENDKITIPYFNKLRHFIENIRR